MHKFAKHSMLLLLAISLVMIPFASAAYAQPKIESKEPSAGAMTYDLFIMRPFGAVATVLGSVVFVISIPFTAIAGMVPTAGKKLVVDPFNYTIVRPLGTWSGR